LVLKRLLVVAGFFDVREEAVNDMLRDDEALKSGSWRKCPA